jgi:hypothetical protein
MEIEQTLPTTNGPAWAALLAAGVGCAAFGLLTDVSEASAGAAKFLQWYRPSGSLSGVAGAAVLVWGVTWVILRLRWGDRQLERAGLLTAVTAALVVAGIVMTFPPFYELFAPG